MIGKPRPLAFLDANVLYPALPRNILMRLARRDLFRAFWSDRVHDEWTGSRRRGPEGDALKIWLCPIAPGIPLPTLKPLT